MFGPEVVDGLKILDGDRFHLGEEDVAAFHGGFSGYLDEKATSFFVCFSEVLVGEVGR